MRLTVKFQLKTLLQVAKAELAKVRKVRAFELETVNIQDPGQERWKRKYVYWIPALHIDGKEVAKGRWDADTVQQALDKWQQTHKSHQEHIDGEKQNAS